MVYSCLPHHLGSEVSGITALLVHNDNVTITAGVILNGWHWKLTD